MQLESDFLWVVSKIKRNRVHRWRQTPKPSGAANVPKSRLIYGRPDRDGKYEMPLPFKDDEVYPPDLGWTTTHALYDRQQSNRSRTTDFNLDRYAQGCKETTTIMCENGVWIKQNKLCCAVPRTNHTVIPTMGRRKFAVAIWMCSGESPGSPSANQYLQHATNTEDYATPRLLRTEPVRLPLYS